MQLQRKSKRRSNSGNITLLEPSLYALCIHVKHGQEMEKVSFKERLIQILSQNGKTTLKENTTTVVDKLRKQERLTDDEFWNVYGSIRQECQDMRTRNPAFWISKGK